MEIYLLSKTFGVISVICDAISLRVTKRFFSHGDMELCIRGGTLIPVAAEYLFDPVSGTCALIERISRDEEGKVTVSGRSLEALLDRRVVYGIGNYTGGVEFAVRNTVNQNAVLNRPLAGLVMGAEAGLKATTAVSTGWEVLSDWVYAALKPHGASYSIKLNSVTGVPEFRIIIGSDRTRGQSVRPPVVFSEDMGGIAGGTYDIDTRELANTAYVMGGDKTCVVCPEEPPEDTDRREMFVPAKDINPEYFSTTEAYVAALKRRGLEMLAKNAGRVRVEGTIPDGAFVYGRDYSLGDLCDVDLADGRRLSVRVTSVTYEYCGGEVRITPAFGDEGLTLRQVVRDESLKLLATM